MRNIINTNKKIVDSLFNFQREFLFEYEDSCNHYRRHITVLSWTAENVKYIEESWWGYGNIDGYKIYDDGMFDEVHKRINCGPIYDFEDYYSIGFEGDVIKIWKVK